MRLALPFFAALAACASAPRPASVASPEARGPRPEAPLTEAEIIAKTHAVLDAYDKGELAADLLAPGFFRFEEEKLHDRASQLAAKPHAAWDTRTWKEEHAYVRPNDALFVGRSLEREVANTVHGNRVFDGWYVVGWARNGARWQVTHWTWQPHESDAERARHTWDDIFTQQVGFTHAPNKLLVDTVRGVAPGAALDVMMGQGRNALYLASQGWRVTGVDLSDVALGQARAEAARRHLALDAVQADVDHYDFGTARWDLVTMIYAGDSLDRVKRLQASLKPGGLFVLEYFAAKPGEQGGIDEASLRPLFAQGYDILRDEVVDDVPDWAQDRAKLVRFVARKK